MRTGIFKTALIAASLFLSLAPMLPADTVILNNRERVKGVVVEEYSDRIVISTEEGEREIPRDSINRIIYDLEEQNLTSLGDFYHDRGMLKTAYHYYEQAIFVNPDYKRAREGLHYVSTLLQQSGHARKLDHIRRMRDEQLWRQQGILPGEAEVSETEKLRDMIGITLKDVKGVFEVSDVARGSPAHGAGLLRGDVIVAAWGRNITYMRPEEVVDKLTSPEVMEVRLSIKRSVMMDLGSARGGYSSMIGAQLGYREMDGLVIERVAPEGAAMSAGLEEGDQVLAIQGESTRYMPMKEVEAIIRGRRGETLSFTIKRDVVMWKKIGDR